jgi:polyprenyl-phospho-N-acetylgalactosaminyl synthase
MANTEVAVIIPAYNEFSYIRRVITDVRKFVRTVIIVDDGSDDGDYQELKKPDIYVLRHLVNLGKGAALTTGVEFARSLNFQKVIFMDADRQHDGRDLPAFIRSLKKNHFVLGRRKLSLRRNGVRFLGNRLDALLIKLLFGKTVADPLCGFRGFNLDIYPQISWKSTGYSVETEMVLAAIKRHISYIELPVRIIYLDKFKGVSMLDAYKVFFDVLKWRLPV